MKIARSIIPIIIISAAISLLSCNQKGIDNDAEKISSEQNGEFYQMKTYTFDSDEQVSVTEGYLKEALLPGLKKLGIKNVGVFKLRPNETDSTKKIFMLIPFSSLSQFQNLEKDLSSDEAYLSAGSEYLMAPYDNPPYQRIESTLLKAFDGKPFMKTPEIDGPRANRVYELRSYQSATEAIHNSKVDMFNAGGEIKLFEKLEFNAVFYGKVISGSQMPNLMYMITFSDEESQKAHWDAFVNSPEWNELKAIPKYLNTVSHIDKHLLYPTDYSDY